MTQEEKQLLIKDISARLPYRVRIAYKENEHDIHHWTLCTLHAPHISKDGTIIDIGSDGWIEYVEYPGAGMSTGSRPLHLEKMLPYLRPMSSMTEEELKELNDKYGIIAYFFIQEPPYYYGLQAQHSDIGSIEISEFSKIYDWLNAHQFDYCGLIEKGLALEAPEGMYKEE